MRTIVPFEATYPETLLIGQKRFSRYRHVTLYRYEQMFFGCEAYIRVKTLLRTKSYFYSSVDAAMRDFREIDADTLLRQRGDRHEPRPEGAAVLW